MPDRAELARLWKTILETDSDQLFGADAARLERRPDLGDELAQPGFVGPSYQPGGLLFLAKNPGSGGSSLSAAEERHLRVLRDLKSAPPESLLKSFEALMSELLDIMPGWPVFQHYVRPIISEVGLTHESVAYINLIKWRTKKEPGSWMFRRSWLAHTQEQYRLLRPRHVVVLGITTGGRFRDLLRWYGATKPDHLEVLKRRRSDKQEPYEHTKQHMREITRRLRDRQAG